MSKINTQYLNEMKKDPIFQQGIIKIGEVERLAYVNQSDIETYTGQKLSKDELIYLNQFIATASFFVNDLSGSQIENLPNGFNDLSDIQKFWVKKATLFLVMHYFSGAFGWGVGSEAVNQGQQNYSFSTSPEFVEYIMPHVHKCLQAAGLFIAKLPLKPLETATCTTNPNYGPWAGDENYINWEGGNLRFIRTDNVTSKDGSVAIDHKPNPNTGFAAVDLSVKSGATDPRVDKLVKEVGEITELFPPDRDNLVQAINDCDYDLKFDFGYNNQCQRFLSITKGQKESLTFDLFVHNETNDATTDWVAHTRIFVQITTGGVGGYRASWYLVNSDAPNLGDINTKCKISTTFNPDTGNLAIAICNVSMPETSFFVIKSNSRIQRFLDLKLTLIVEGTNIPLILPSGGGTTIIKSDDNTLSISPITGGYNLTAGDYIVSSFTRYNNSLVFSQAVLEQQFKTPTGTFDPITNLQPNIIQSYFNTTSKIFYPSEFLILAFRYQKNPVIMIDDAQTGADYSPAITLPDGKRIQLSFTIASDTRLWVRIRCMNCVNENMLTDIRADDFEFINIRQAKLVEIIKGDGSLEVTFDSDPSNSNQILFKPNDSIAIGDTRQGLKPQYGLVIIGKNYMRLYGTNTDPSLQNPNDIITANQIDTKISAAPFTKTDLTNVRVDIANAGKMFVVAPDGSIIYSDIPKSGNLVPVKYSGHSTDIGAVIIENFPQDKKVTEMVFTITYGAIASDGLVHTYAGSSIVSVSANNVNEFAKPPLNGDITSFPAFSDIDSDNVKVRYNDIGKYFVIDPDKAITSFDTAFATNMEPGPTPSPPFVQKTYPGYPRGSYDATINFLKTKNVKDMVFSYSYIATIEGVNTTFAGTSDTAYSINTAADFMKPPHNGFVGSFYVTSTSGKRDLVEIRYLDTQNNFILTSTAVIKQFISASLTNWEPPNGPIPPRVKREIHGVAQQDSHGNLVTVEFTGIEPDKCFREISFSLFLSYNRAPINFTYEWNKECRHFSDLGLGETIFDDNVQGVPIRIWKDSDTSLKINSREGLVITNFGQCLCDYYDTEPHDPNQDNMVPLEPIKGGE